MLSMFPRAVLKGIAITAVAIPASSFFAFAASPAFADEAAVIAANKPVRGKRTNGRDSTSNEVGQSSDDRSSGSNGRARANGAAGLAAAESERPVELEFARETSTSSRSAGSNGRGRGSSAVTSELNGFAVADATPEALENAAPGTMSDLLADYRQKRLALFRAAEHQRNAYDNFVHLSTLDDASIATKFPNGDYDDTLQKAKDTFLTLRSAVERRQDETKNTLFEIAGGRQLSVDAVRELHSLLGV